MRQVLDQLAYGNKGQELIPRIRMSHRSLETIPLGPSTVIILDFMLTLTGGC